MARTDNSIDPEPKLTGIPPVWDGRFGSPALSFASPQDEFRYLVMKTEAQRRQKALETIARGLSFPEGDLGWPGKLPVMKSATDTAAEQAISFWETKKASLWGSQHSFAKKFAEYIELRNKEEAERKEQVNVELTTAAISNKRKADFDLPDQKKIKLYTGLPPHINEELSDAAVDYLNDEKDREEQVKLRLKGISPEDDARIAREYLAERDQGDHAAHLEHIEANKNRAAYGKPLVAMPHRWRFRTAEIQKHIQDVSAWKHAQQRAAGPVGVQTPEERRAIIQQQINSNKAMEEELKKAKAKSELGEAFARRKRDYEEKQRLGLEEIARLKKAAEEKKKADIEQANFYRGLYGAEWDGSVGGEVQTGSLGLISGLGYTPSPTIELGQKYFGGKTSGQGQPPGFRPSGQAQGTTTGGQASTEGPQSTGAFGQAPFGGYGPQTTFGGFIDEEDAAIQWAIAESLSKESAAQAAAIQKQADLEASRASHGLFKERREILENRARSAGMTPLEFANREGHENVTDYLKFETDKAILQQTTPNMSPLDKFLAINRLEYKNALEFALRANRDLHGIEIQEFLRSKDWHGTLAKYLENMATKQVTANDCPNITVPTLEPPLSRNASEKERQAYNARGMAIRAEQAKARRINEQRWRGLQERIRNVAQFEVRIAGLEEGKATTHVVREVYDGKDIKGLVF